MRFNFFKQKKTFPTQNKKVKVGLALGGGASRGVAHIGVIKAFEENNIKFDFIAGTSVGAIIGAMYAGGKSSSEMLEIAKSLDLKDIRGKRFMFMPSKTVGIKELMIGGLGDINIEDLKIPFCAVAVDLKSSNEVLITKGNLASAVAGSCAVPGIFIPVEFKDFHLSDGGLQNNIPSDSPRYFGCDYVIAVDVNSTRGEGTNSLKVVDVLMASIRIMSKSNCIKGYLNADLIIQPSMKKYKSTKIDEVDAMFAEGYQACIDKIPEILNLLSKKPNRILKRKYRNIGDRKPKII